jgi:hypothetical protein
MSWPHPPGGGKRSGFGFPFQVGLDETATTTWTGKIAIVRRIRSGSYIARSVRWSKHGIVARNTIDASTVKKGWLGLIMLPPCGIAQETTTTTTAAVWKDTGGAHSAQTLVYSKVFSTTTNAISRRISQSRECGINRRQV